MSQVELYHYQKGKAEPTLHKIHNANAFYVGLVKLFTSDITILMKDQETVIKPAFNTFQASDVPDWQKIATGFLSTYTLVLDEYRGEVAEALYKTFEQIDNGNFEPTIRNVGDTIVLLEKGPIVVTTNFENIYGFPYETVENSTGLKAALEKYKGNISEDKLEELTEEYTFEKAVSMDEVLSLTNAMAVPRYWK